MVKHFRNLLGSLDSGIVDKQFVVDEIDALLDLYLIERKYEPTPRQSKKLYEYS